MLLPQRPTIHTLLQLVFGPSGTQTANALNLFALVSQLLQGMLAADPVHAANDHGGQSGM